MRWPSALDEVGLPHACRLLLLQRIQQCLLVVNLSPLVVSLLLHQLLHLFFDSHELEVFPGRLDGQRRLGVELRLESCSLVLHLERDPIEVVHVESIAQDAVVELVVGVDDRQPSGLHLGEDEFARVDIELVLRKRLLIFLLNLRSTESKGRMAHPVLVDAASDASGLVLALDVLDFAFEHAHVGTVAFVVVLDEVLHRLQIFLEDSLLVGQLRAAHVRRNDVVLVDVHVRGWLEVSHDVVIDVVDLVVDVSHVAAHHLHVALAVRPLQQLFVHVLVSVH